MTVKLRYKLVIQTNSQKVIKEMYPNETAEHHRDHRCRNKEVNQFCYDPISKYRGNFCGCITRHHPVWAGSRSWVSRHLSLHIRIRGDEVRVRSCLIFRYRIWPKKQCILEKHSNLLQKYNSCRLLLTITHKYLSSHETRKHRHIFARVAAFWQRVFQTLPNLDVRPGVAVYHTLKIFSSVNAKDLLMPHTEFEVCTLKINTIFRHRKKKIPLLLNRSVHCTTVLGRLKSNRRTRVSFCWCTYDCSNKLNSPISRLEEYIKFDYIHWYRITKMLKLLPQSHHGSSVTLVH